VGGADGADHQIHNGGVRHHRKMMTVANGWKQPVVRARD